MRPSFIAAGINGLLMLIATIMIIINYRNLSKEMAILFILLLAIAYGIHAILHYFEEVYYNYNPLKNKWTIHSEPEYR